MYYAHMSFTQMALGLYRILAACLRLPSLLFYLDHNNQAIPIGNPRPSASCDPTIIECSCSSARNSIPIAPHKPDARWTIHHHGSSMRRTSPVSWRRTTETKTEAEEKMEREAEMEGEAQPMLQTHVNSQRDHASRATTRALKQFRSEDICRGAAVSDYISQIERYGISSLPFSGLPRELPKSGHDISSYPGQRATPRRLDVLPPQYSFEALLAGTTMLTGIPVVNMARLMNISYACLGIGKLNGGNVDKSCTKDDINVKHEAGMKKARSRWRTNDVLIDTGEEVHTFDPAIRRTLDMCSGNFAAEVGLVPPLKKAEAEPCALVRFIDGRQAGQARTPTNRQLHIYDSTNESNACTNAIHLALTDAGRSCSCLFLTRSEAQQYAPASDPRSVFIDEDRDTPHPGDHLAGLANLVCHLVASAVYARLRCTSSVLRLSRSPGRPLQAWVACGQPCAPFPYLGSSLLWASPCNPLLPSTNIGPFRRLSSNVPLRHPSAPESLFASGHSSKLRRGSVILTQKSMPSNRSARGCERRSPASVNPHFGSMLAPRPCELPDRSQRLHNLHAAYIMSDLAGPLKKVQSLETDGPKTAGWKPEVSMGEQESASALLSPPIVSTSEGTNGCFNGPMAAPTTLAKAISKTGNNIKAPKNTTDTRQRRQKRNQATIREKKVTRNGWLGWSRSAGLHISPCLILPHWLTSFYNNRKRTLLTALRKEGTKSEFNDDADDEAEGRFGSAEAGASRTFQTFSSVSSQGGQFNDDTDDEAEGLLMTPDWGVDADGCADAAPDKHGDTNDTCCLFILSPEVRYAMASIGRVASIPRLSQQFLHTSTLLSRQQRDWNMSASLLETIRH
ncbi:uncharacterized protein MYCFIDRAFT_180136 [Pseudocercospora fijiensis CIRAD86]|uniref:Uncharacterized protein n=1 Tax=Pseudocercospora fijiensis (strain CIRAD86) TaxID=383855 RepID=M2ZDF0_PSEFD|nr:uncharacterized protein MYCFIDRAFT_180136 [Pseudocercospora fijiensis CIRAD86]EME77134.1 hypothetical protein MYCFIDRAFT_180136 [Pseudocercospora fijiensis CIRAD86]